MTIKALSKFLKDKAPNSILQIPFNQFSGRSIALDGDNWMVINMARARRDVVARTKLLVDEPSMDEILRTWIEYCLRSVGEMATQNIEAIIVFDGVAPDEKRETRNKRQEDRQLVANEIKTIRRQIDEGITNPSQLKRLESLYNRHLSIPPEFKEALRQRLEENGIKYLQAVGEAEQLCASLARENKVAAVWTRDLDALVHGAPIIIKEQYGGYCKIIVLAKVLEELQLTFPMFVDVCIMAGCDYNTNIKNTGVGKAYKLIKRYGSLENVERNTDLDMTCLCYHLCRYYFRAIESSELTVE